jgi:hypothetical protein
MPFPDIPVNAVEHYGQCSEDIIVRSLLRAIAIRKNVDLREKLYLEIGGNHPFATSRMLKNSIKPRAVDQRR